ncbi:MAG: type I-MYXAN CRISPR-associated protein Cas6/Cmx6 [Burkholderiales bacterium]|nr:type I-MYXAN CRISPR-associated protein Cas6/Cmx6 [Burkholderiales bacterium]
MPADMLDVAFAVTGGRLPAEHRRALADAIDAALPWLAVTPDVGMHPLKLARSGPEPLLSARTRLTLRLPRSRAPEAAALAGRELAFGEGRLRLGDAHCRELLPWGTLYAHCVAALDGDDEAGFLRAVQAELDALGVVGRVICGLARRGADGTVLGYGVMVDGLSAADSLTLQQHGVGAGRRFGYGLFVPHKSAAAVGAPA